MSSATRGQPDRPDAILLVEDSDADVRVMRRAFQKAGMENQLEHFASAAVALDHLSAVSASDDQSKPALIFLDLNLPGMDGRAFLRALKKHDQLRVIPVVILSTSDDVDDVMECYALGASAYITKPDTLEGFVSVFRSTKDFWFGACELPLRS